jgi:hypothetical protein
MSKGAAWLNRPSIAARLITAERMHARALALEECAEHLGLDWTDHADERQEGNQLADMLREEATAWRERAHRFNKWPAGPYQIGHRTQLEKKLLRKKKETPA